jgi:CRISPR/Cas system-associated endonuclease Cas1
MRSRPQVLVVGSNAALRIRRGALEIEHSDGPAKLKIRLDIDDPMPCAILFDGRGEFLTGDALRFCARHGIALVIPDGPGRTLTFIETALEARDGAATIADVSPLMIRTQCVADPLEVAREIVRAKIARASSAVAAQSRTAFAGPRAAPHAAVSKQRVDQADAFGEGRQRGRQPSPGAWPMDQVGGLGEGRQRARQPSPNAWPMDQLDGLDDRAADADRATFDHWMARTNTARTMADLLIIEARASAAYWRSYRHLGLREARGGNLPRSWLRFANRNKGAQFLGNKHASHPINAMLNYAYVVEAGRLARALHARGLALQIGFLDADKGGRNSLVWDAIEPLRPAIDARVFAYIASREFRRTDFVPCGANVCRLDREITSNLLTSACLPQRDINGAADWLRDLIMAEGSAREHGLRGTAGRRGRAADFHMHERQQS